MAADSCEPLASLAETRPRRWLWLYALGLTLIVAYFILPQTVGGCIRSHLLTRMQQHWPDFTVRLGAVRFEPGVGVLVDDLRIWPKEAKWNDAPLVHVQRIVVRTMQLEQWTKNPFASERLILSGIRCDARPSADGRWKLADLWPPPNFGPGSPLITVRDSEVRVFQNDTSESVSLHLRELNAEVVKSSQGTRFQGSVFTDVSGQIAIHGELDSTGQLAAVATVNRLRVDPALIRRLPAAFAKSTEPLLGLTCIANLAIRAEGKPAQGIQTATAIEFIEGRFAHPRLVYPLEQLRGKFTVRSTGIDIVGLGAQYGGAQLTVAGQIHGLTPDSPADLHVVGQQLAVNQAQIEMLPPSLHLVWKMLQPQGIVDVNLKLVRREKWRAYGEARVRDMEVKPEMFPYRVQQVDGLLRINGDHLSAMRVEANAGGQRVHIDFNSIMVRGGPLDLRVLVDGPLPIDEPLLAALTPRGRTTSGAERVARSLSPQGKLQVLDAHIQRDDQGRLTRSIKLRVMDGRMRCQAFRYPIYDIQGQIEIDEHGLRLSEFRGQNNEAATVNLTGRWVNAVGLDNGRLDLKIDGYGVPLDDSLRSALPASVRYTWDALAPSGTLDHVHVHVSYEEGLKPDFAITAHQWGSEGRVPHVVSLQPTAFPYRLDVRRARVRLNDETVIIEELEGWHNASHLTTTGNCTRNRDGKWVLHLDVLPGSRLLMEADLLSVLPEGARRALTEISVRGPVGIRGTADIGLPDKDETESELNWNLLLQLEGNELGRESEVRAVRGELTFAGARQGDSLRASGQLNVDSLHTHNIQVTGLSGPYELRDGVLYWGRTLGNGANDIQDNDLVPITGGMFGGQVTIDGKLSLADSRFDLAANLVDADVPTMLTELGQQQSAVRGRCGFVMKKLDGILGERRSISGSGTAYLREANIYQLPPIVSLLRVLRITPSEDAAFTTGDTQFQIDGDRIVFNSIQLWGDIIALYGVGTVNTWRDLDLTFDTRVSPQNVWNQVVKPVTGQRYNLWSVQVGGTVSDPQIRRMPQMEEALDRLLPVTPQPADQEAEKTILGSLPLLRNLTW